MTDHTNNEHSPSIRRLSRDLVNAAMTMSAEEARYLVDNYYVLQEGRKRADNQARSMGKEEPHVLISWLAEQSDTLEGQIKRALDRYTDTLAPGRWMKSLYGVGPVISAGLCAHIDIERAPSVGHIYSFAGIAGSGQKPWKKGEIRPFNAELRTLCWKIGQSFMKFSGQEECLYGGLYRERKIFEIANNESGALADQAKAILEAKNFRKTTDAYKAYSAGKLPPAHVDARARRFAVKLFLAHLHTVMYFDHYGVLPAHPYPISHLGHVHHLPVPNANVVAGLEEALRKHGMM